MSPLRTPVSAIVRSPFVPSPILPLAIALSALGCGGGPFGLFPGGSLSGETRPPPALWSSLGTAGTAQLETNPAEPYSVNLAFTVVDEKLYLNAGDTETQWVRNMDADPRVRLRIEGVIYELRAERVSDPVEVARFGKAWTSQSSLMRDPAELDEAWVYRLHPR